MSWWTESSSWKWWEEYVEVVPRTVAAGSWEGAVTSFSATETWDWTDPGPSTPGPPGAWGEEVPRRVSRPGSAQTPGKGELLGFRWRRHPLTGQEVWVREASESAPAWTDAPSQRGNSTERPTD